MTDEEYMDQVIREYGRIDDDPDLEIDFFDFINMEEDLGNVELVEGDPSPVRRSNPSPVLPST